MSELTIYARPDDPAPQVFTDFEGIRDHLDAIGVGFERWEASKPLAADGGQEEVLEAYKEDVARLTQQYGFQSVDVVALTPDNPKKGELRQMFLSEHTHDDFEVRFFVDGSGMFYLHPGDAVYMMRCDRGDLISVPAGTRHWFDMGPEPFFKAIRLFTTPDGWQANFTGDAIADDYPRFGE